MVICLYLGICVLVIVGNMAIIKVKEFIGTSEKSFEDALKNIIAHICSHKQNVTGAKVLSQSVSVKDGKITEYKVNTTIAYLWDEAAHK